MISGKKVAAVIVAYNAEKTLERTVRGIPPNTADDIIIIDDASTDRTLGPRSGFLALLPFAIPKTGDMGRLKRPDTEKP